MLHEIEPLLIINDLSQMLGVPFYTLYGWRHRGQGHAAIGSGGTCDTGRPASRLGSPSAWTSGGDR